MDGYDETYLSVVLNGFESSGFQTVLSLDLMFLIFVLCTGRNLIVSSKINFFYCKILHIYPLYCTLLSYKKHRSFKKDEKMVIADKQFVSTG